MGQINLFHIVVIVLGIGIFLYLKPSQESVLSFYGFAESNETEINYNYPVVVDDIKVSSGQRVNQGDTLLLLSRRKSKETLADQSFQIKKLRAEWKEWEHKQNAEIKSLELDKASKIKELDFQIKQLENEKTYKDKLAKSLKSVDVPPGAFNPLQEKIDALLLEKLELMTKYSDGKSALSESINLGINPYSAQIEKLQAEIKFDEEHKVQNIAVLAPSDGLIGNISCKEEEHIPSYSTLLSFYEPHSGIIKGFVHEDMTLQVKIGDPFIVQSLKDEMIQFSGEVVGLGSRIVEIPPRLRKLSDVKIYGREVLVEISKENTFLQKEKVSVKADNRDHD